MVSPKPRIPGLASSRCRLAPRPRSPMDDRALRAVPLASPTLSWPRGTAETLVPFSQARPPSASLAEAPHGVSPWGSVGTGNMTLENSWRTNGKTQRGSGAGQKSKKPVCLKTVRAQRALRMPLRSLLPFRKATPWRALPGERTAASRVPPAPATCVIRRPLARPFPSLQLLTPQKTGDPCPPPTPPRQPHTREEAQVPWEAPGLGTAAAPDWAPRQALCQTCAPNISFQFSPPWGSRSYDLRFLKQGNSLRKEALITRSRSQTQV